MMDDARLADAIHAAYEGLVEADKALHEFRRIFDAAQELVSAMDDLASQQHPVLVPIIRGESEPLISGVPGLLRVVPADAS